ncbi:MAG: sugar phosphate isomerase/epimerase [Bacillota bacterium]|nr:sugar phosphate isomerase/epimerase [Bacillota bacterium]
MKVGLSSAIFYPKVNTEDAIDKICELGFECAEVFLNSMCEYDEEFVKKLSDRKNQNNIDIISVHAFSSSFEPYLFDAYKRRREDMLSMFKKVCKAGKILGAKYYTFHGLRQGVNKFLDDKFILEIYNELIYIAGENEMKLAQENVSWCMSSDINFIEMLKERCSYPLYFTLDLKQSYRACIEPDKYIEAMGDRLVNIHINDKNDTNSCLLPGKGDINYKSLFSKLNSINYKGNAIIEVYSDNYTSFDDIRQAHYYLKDLFHSKQSS